MMIYYWCVCVAVVTDRHLQSQLEHAHRIKDERSAEALTAKRNAADLEQKASNKNERWLVGCLRVHDMLSTLRFFQFFAWGVGS